MRRLSSPSDSRRNPFARLRSLALAWALASAALSAACGGAGGAKQETVACSAQAPCVAGQRCASGACVPAECLAGATRPCGPEPVGACRQGTQSCVDGLFETGCPGQVLPSAEVCDAGQVDENCDGAVNEGCGCAPLDSTVACCGGRGVQTCLATAGGSAYSACSVAPTTEVCNGIDDDCDGLVDEEDVPLCGAGNVCNAGSCGCAGGAAPLGCAVDADGDLRSPDLSALTPLCAAPDRPEAGNCPAGFVLPKVAQGLDCDDADPKRFSLALLRADQDGDGACVGAVSEACIGAVPAGQRLAAACLATDDCDDANAAAFVVSVLRTDADGDGYCVGAASARCVGAKTPAGLRSPDACQPTDDCDDFNGTTFVLATLRTDADNDGYCVGATASLCIGATLPSSLRLASSCLGEDCRDTNPLATSTCVVVGGYTTASAVKTCFAVPATETFSVSVTQLCPFGFQLGPTVRADKVSGNGFCTALNATTVSMTCNGLDGATCRIVGDCLAL